jgi:hypothetical protein
MRIVDPATVRDTVDEFVLAFNLEKVPSYLRDLHSGR